MSKTTFSVSAAPKVNIRCQFETIPGVTHITLGFSPKEECIFGTVKLYGGIGGNEFTLDHQEIYGALKDEKVGTLYLFNDETFKDIAAALKAGSEKLIKMIKASGYVSNPF